MTLVRRRRRVRRVLRKLKDRLVKLSRADRYRLGRTRAWKLVYQARLKSLGADHPSTHWALHKYRTSRALGNKIDKKQAVLHRRADRKLRWLRKHPAPLDPDGNGLILVDGVQVAALVGGEVLRIRKGGRWKGRAVSGYRTPEYSEQLCYGICGAPTCPGRCAGRSTRHAQKGGRSGAIDLTDYLTFATECRRLGSWLENHLPNDLVHFSDAGN